MHKLIHCTSEIACLKQAARPRHGDHFSVCWSLLSLQLATGHTSFSTFTFSLPKPGLISSLNDKINFIYAFLL